MTRLQNGRVRCCGRFCLVYKSRNKAFCPKCYHSYNLNSGKHLTPSEGCWMCGQNRHLTAIKAEREHHAERESRQPTD